MDFEKLVKNIVDSIHNLRIYLIELYKLVRDKLINLYLYILKSIKGKDKDKVKELN